jgi:hypothetical protein
MRRGSCESTVMRIVAGTPAHLCFVDEDAFGREINTYVQNRDIEMH